MNYECKNCAKEQSCFKAMRFKFGFCETDFKPKPKERSAGMQWVKLTSTEWEARGKYGVFKIERAKGKWQARFASEDTAFKMPPKSKLEEAKEMCEDNAYWEDAV